MTVQIILLLILNITLSAYVLYKLRKAHLMLYAMKERMDQAPSMSFEQAQFDNLFKQIEAFLGLNVELKSPWSLPQTRNWAASPDILLFLAKHALKYKPQIMVECSSGVSTLVLARSAQLNGKGHVFSLEHDSVFADKTRAELERLKLTEWATVIHAPLMHYEMDGESFNWYTLDKLPPKEGIELLVIDGPPAGKIPMARYPAIPKLYERLSEEAYVFLDDYERPGEQRVVSGWQKKYSGLVVESLPCEKGAALITVRKPLT